MNNQEVNGIINCTAPKPVKNTDLMASLRKYYGFSFGLSSPTWLLEIGAIMIGTETELILKSRWVVPTRLLENQYKFIFPTLEYAMKDILSIKV